MSIVKEILESLKNHPEDWTIGSYGSPIHKRCDLVIREDGSIRNRAHNEVVALKTHDRWRIRRAVIGMLSLRHFELKEAEKHE